MLRKANLFKKIRNPPCLQSAMQLYSAAPHSVVEVQRCSNKSNKSKSLIDWLDMWWKQTWTYLVTLHHCLNLVLQRGHNQRLRRSLCAAPVACKRELANRRVLQPVQAQLRLLSLAPEIYSGALRSKEALHGSNEKRWKLKTSFWMLILHLLSAVCSTNRI